MDPISKLVSKLSVYFIGVLGTRGEILNILDVYLFLVKEWFVTKHFIILNSKNNRNVSIKIG